MENFRIEFNDIQENEVYAVTKQFDDLADATKYAQTILATTSDECVSFNIINL